MSRLTPLLAVAVGAAALGIFGPMVAPSGSGLFTVPLPVDVPAVRGLLSGTDATGVTSAVTFGPLYIDGRGDSRETVVGNGGWVSLVAGYGSRSGDPHVSLERRVDAGEWERVDAQVERTSTGALQVRTPVWSTFSMASDVQYRLASDDGPGGGTTTSSPITVHYENQRFYSGVAATIYEAVALYCPSTAVRIVDLPERQAGLFGTGSQLIRIDSAVGVTTATRSIDIRSVALHECSHERQWMNYGGTTEGRATMEAAAGSIFSEFRKPADVVTPYEYREPEGGSISPIEHAADCGAQSMNPGGDLGYGGWCSQAQLDAGRRVLLGSTY